MLWLARFPPDPIGPVDAEGYHLLAVNVLARRGFAIGWDPPFCPTSVRTPLYPLFLMGTYSLLGSQPYHVVLIHILLEMLTTALVLRLGATLGGRRVALVAGLCYALNGTTQRYTGFLFAETWLMPLMTAALWRAVVCLRRPSVKRVAVCALFWALALLTKPNIQFLVLFVGGWVSGVLLTQPIARHTSGQRFFASRSLTLIWRAAIFWVMLLAVLCPWLVRNRVVLGNWTLSSAFDENLARVSAVATLAEVEGVLADPWTETWEYLYGRLVIAAATQFPEVDADSVSACELLQQQRQAVSSVARDIVLQHWKAFVKTHVGGVALSFLDPGHRLWYTVLTGRVWQTTGVIDNVWKRVAWSLKEGAVGDAARVLWLERVLRIPPFAALIWWGLLLGRVMVAALCARGAWRLRHARAVVLVLLGTVLYILILPGPIAHDRFYLPAIPSVVSLLAVGFPRHIPLSDPR